MSVFRRTYDGHTLRPHAIKFLVFDDFGPPAAIAIYLAPTIGIGIREFVGSDPDDMAVVFVHVVQNVVKAPSHGVVYMPQPSRSRKLWSRIARQRVEEGIVHQLGDNVRGWLLRCCDQLLGSTAITVEIYSPSTPKLQQAETSCCSMWVSDSKIESAYTLQFLRPTLYAFSMAEGTTVYLHLYTAVVDGLIVPPVSNAWATKCFEYDAALWVLTLIKDEGMA
jgi:hypothetical protein